MSDDTLLMRYILVKINILILNIYKAQYTNKYFIRSLTNVCAKFQLPPANDFVVWIAETYQFYFSNTGG